MFGKRTKLVTLLLAFILILSQSIVFAQSADNYAVEITGIGIKELKFTIEELKAMPAEAQIHEEYIYNSKTGEKAAQVKGVSLAYILTEKADVTAGNAEVTFVASDGYPIDPQLLQDILNKDLKYVLAYEIDGKVINNDDIADNEEITVYRKVKEVGEFGTVFKMVVKIIVGESTKVSEEPEATTEVVAEVEESIVFIDITEEYKFAEIAIQELSKKGIIGGMGNGLYVPQGEFTRAQFCKIMVEALGYEQKEYNGAFTDVKKSDWFAPYVQAAVDAGLFQGYTDGTFKPNQSIIRQEMGAVVARGAVLAEVVAQEKMAKFVMEKSKYTDKDAVATWAANGVAWLESKGVFADIATEEFEPTKVVNRAEAATIVYNTLFKE